MQEVEVKYRVRDLTVLEEALAGKGVLLSAPVVQDDQAYGPGGWEFGESKFGVTFGRLRSEGGRHVFTVKKPMANDLACLEHETVVADREEMHRALVLLGMRPMIRIVKKRRTGRWGDVAVCVDEVEGVGAFLELERVVAVDVSAEAVQEELDGLVGGLNLGLVRVTQTYDSLVRAAQS